MSEVQFFGETFRLADEPDEWTLAEFAQTASHADASATGAAGLAVMASVMDALEAGIHADDWQRFRALAKKKRAKIETDLMPVVVAMFMQETGRPTQQPSDSSGGLLTIVPTSPAVSSSPVIDRLVGRPDLMVIVEDAAAARLTG